MAAFTTILLLSQNISSAFDYIPFGYARHMAPIFFYECTYQPTHCNTILYPSNFFLSVSVALESICYRMAVNRLIYESNTTGGLTKNWAGRRSSYDEVSIAWLLLCITDIGMQLLGTWTRHDKFQKIHSYRKLFGSDTGRHPQIQGYIFFSFLVNVSSIGIDPRLQLR